ncbi:MAG: CoA transferase, partial [Chloroflexota bacterium]|nr:CoA transferase [Chloroflexota bacterium]
MLLADLGADVIKVEPPDGDPTRHYGPPNAGKPEPGTAYDPPDPRADPAYPGESGYFMSINRNKRGMRLDLKQAGAREVLGRIVQRSDVLVENQRSGGLDRLGFPDEELDRINPRLVRLSITGYGPTGPDAGKPGFDFIIQAASGLMSITGQPDEAGGEPTKVGVAVSDLTTGMLGAVAVLAGLREAERTGRGQRIDLSLLESSVAWLINQAANHLVGGTVPGRLGNRHPNITPYETFPTEDGQIAVAVGSERQWQRFCDALGAPELATDPRFATNGERVRQRDELRGLLVARFAERPSAEWLEVLSAGEVPCGPVRDLAQVFTDPQVLERDMVATVEHPTVGELRLTGIPFKFAATPGSIRRPPPLLGQH